MDRHSKETTLLIDLTFFFSRNSLCLNEWRRMNEDQQSYFGLNGNEENELQKKRDNWVYIKMKTRQKYFLIYFA